MIRQAEQGSRRAVLYLPWVILILGLISAVAAWRKISAHEHMQLHWATKLAAEAIRTDLVEDMEWQGVGLDRLALLWEAADPPQPLWTSSARLYIQHRPGCVAVEWITPDQKEREVVTDKLARTLAYGGVPNAALDAAKHSRVPLFSIPAAANDGSAQYAIAFPVYANDKLRGFIVSFFDVARSLNNNLGDVSGLGFSFGITLPGLPEHTLPGTNREHERDWSTTIPVPLPGVTWHLRVWPTADAVAKIRSTFPDMTLLLGTVLSVLASFTLYFAIRVSDSSTRTKKTNHDLQREMAVREGAEKELRRARDELETRVQERTRELATANVLLQSEVSEHERAEHSLRKLADRLFRVQDEERRRLARELHDGATQNLVALSMEMAMIRDAIRAGETGTEERLDTCARLARQCTEELRTISYLLHPPLLNDLGLAPALREFVEGFARRSGIRITLDISAGLGRFEQQLELTVFRIVQEALSNIHRHACSRTATVTLARDSDFLHLEVADAGRGMPPEVVTGNGSAAGVGLAAIRERVRLVGGHLDIHSDASGTTINAVMPAAHLAINKASTSDSDSGRVSPVPL